MVNHHYSPPFGRTSKSKYIRVCNFLYVPFFLGREGSELNKHHPKRGNVMVSSTIYIYIYLCIHILTFIYILVFIFTYSNLHGNRCVLHFLRGYNYPVFLRDSLPSFFHWHLGSKVVW